MSDDRADVRATAESMAMGNTFDHDMMAIALTMAARGLGTTAPNPSVGTVIADPAAGEVIARAWTRPGGRPHAETEAIRAAGPRAAGATLYVTLEPCAHHGVTPPCADAIVAAALKRVVIGIGDPDPRTAGQGIARLRAAGIEVETGVLAAEAHRMALGHILRVTERRPMTTLKVALDADGNAPRGRAGKPSWVTGPFARAAGHLLRAEADAILVGAATVRDDDPELTCRLRGLEDRSPLRFVVSETLDVPLSARLVVTARAHPTAILTTGRAEPSQRKALAAAGVEIVTVAEDGPGLTAHAIGRALADRGITRLLVEGGPRMWQLFAAGGLADEVVVFRAGGDDRPPDALPGFSLAATGLTLSSIRRIGEDTCFAFRRA